MDPSDQVRFNGWTLYRRSGELEHDGQRIRLQSQPLQLLEELLARPGELVTREELITRLWPRGVVDFDTALNSTVRRLRTALGDHAETPRFIETIPRRGYRFIGSFETTAPLPTAIEPPRLAPSARRPRWLALASLAVAVGAAVWLLATPPTESVAPAAPAAEPHTEAQERLARATHFLKRRAPGDAARALQYFGEALAIDPTLAEAWAGSASAHFFELVDGNVATEIGLARMRDAAERALAINPESAEAQLRLATYRWLIDDSATAEQHLHKALELDPDNPLALGQLASVTAAAGRLPEAIALQRRAMQADPVAAVYRYNLASLLYLAGEFEEARERLLEVRELTQSHWNVEEMLALLDILQGRPADALEAMSAFNQRAAHAQVNALAYQALGQPDGADAALATLTQLARDEDPFRVAEVYAYRGEIDEAFTWLSLGRAQAAERTSFTKVGRPLWLVRLSPLLRPLHQDPRWPSALLDQSPSPVPPQRVVSTSDRRSS